jgi:hypothetical protein
MEEKESFTDEPEQNNKPEEINVYKEDIIEHIAGFVVKQLNEIIDCSICCSVLKDQYRKHTLIDIKNRGGLKKPPFDVIKICKITEKIFISRIYEVPKLLGNPINNLTIKTMSQININSLFTILNVYILSLSPINNHLLQII